MAKFDESRAYAAQEEEVYFDDGREIELLHFVYSRSNIEDLRGNPEKVLAAIDEYGRTKRYLMNVGEDKGKIVTDLIKERKPKVMVSRVDLLSYFLQSYEGERGLLMDEQVELGGYVGYSCITFGAALRSVGGERYFSLERSPEFAAVIASLVDLAGLSDLVKVVVGSSDASLRRLHRTGELSRVDLMFLDHYKPAYLPDLKLCEELGLVGEGTWLAADNVIKPGNPPYLAYVRASTKEKRGALEKEGGIGTNGGSNGFAEKTRKQYEKREGEEKLNEQVKGDPSLIYESSIVESFEPTGVPVRL